MEFIASNGLVKVFVRGCKYKLFSGMEGKNSKCHKLQHCSFIGCLFIAVDCSNCNKQQLNKHSNKSEIYFTNLSYLLKYNLFNSLFFKLRYGHRECDLNYTIQIHKQEKDTKKKEI